MESDRFVLDVVAELGSEPATRGIGSALRAQNDLLHEQLLLNRAEAREAKIAAKHAKIAAVIAAAASIISSVCAIIGLLR